MLAGLLAMGLVAALGLWAAGAGDLPEGAFPRVVAATVVIAAGGVVEVSGDVGGLATTDTDLRVMPLSVTLTGALVVGWGFLRPLRHRAVAGAAELAGWAGRIIVLWLSALFVLAFAARQTFEVSLGEGVLEELGDLFGLSPRVGFTTDVPLTLLFGLLWLAGVLVSAMLVARGAPLPARLLRFQASVRPAAYAMVVLLVACVAVGVVVGLVVAATRGHPADTFAVLLLGLPNVVWPVFTVGLGATWDGRVEGPFGLPMPQVLDEVLRGPEVSALTLRSLAGHDGRVWWLVAVDAVLVVAVAAVMAGRSPAGTPAWRHAVRLAIALALAVLTVCLLGRISAHAGLSVLGIGDLGGALSGEVLLEPRPWSASAVALAWGAAAGFLCAPLARWAGRRAGRGRERTR